MDFAPFISVFLLFLLSCSSILAQQPYERKATTNCTITDNSAGVFGYNCSGVNRACQAYLTFRSLPPYTSVSSISALLASDPSHLARVNSVSERAIFETNKLVIVPVNCSCARGFYQVNASYVIQQGDTYLWIANNTFQALSTCHALRSLNKIPDWNLTAGTQITVPLRCACPTKNQTDVGVNYLLSYIITWGNSISTISGRFGVDTGMVFQANQISEQDPTIYPFTTLLVPLQNPPSTVQTVEPPPPPPSPPPPPVSPPTGNSNKTWIYIVVGILSGVALLLVIGTVVYCAFYRKSKMMTNQMIVSESFEAHEKPIKKLETEPQEFLGGISSVAPSLKFYDFGELQAATDNFSVNCLIKGSVYRGTINGDWAAIKKISGDVSKEVNLLSKFNHLNLIRLSGACFNDGHCYLVYEYAANGSLSDWIYYNNSDQKFLNWTHRMQIALDVATGLNYLHSYTSPPHVHKDINSSNVLLDSDFRAKIANLALARSAEGLEGQFALTKHIVGTKGYMAPEYLENGLVSSKLDVYAFGVLMLEMLTGKEAASLYGGNMSLLSDISTALPHEEAGNQNFKDLIDPSLHGRYPSELAIFVVRLINSCLRKDPAGRPGMEEIVQALSGILTTSLSWDLSNNI